MTFLAMVTMTAFDERADNARYVFGPVMTFDADCS